MLPEDDIFEEIGEGLKLIADEPVEFAAATLVNRLNCGASGPLLLGGLRRPSSNLAQVAEEILLHPIVASARPLRSIGLEQLCPGLAQSVRITPC